MIKKKPQKLKKIKPKRPVSKVLHSVRQVLKISHIAEDEAVWQWGEASLEALPARFDLGVWNIWKGSGGEGFLCEYKRIIKDRHLLLFQEALLTLKGLGSFVPSGYAAHHGATYRRKDGLREGVMTVSSARTKDPAQRILCLIPEPLLKTTKATLVTMYKIAGQKNALWSDSLRRRLQHVFESIYRGRRQGLVIYRFETSRARGRPAFRNHGS